MGELVEYPYRRVGGILMPVVPVELSGDRIILAVVDSGAAISVFKADIADLLGLDLESGVKRKLQGIGGSITAYVHRVRIKVAGHAFDSAIAFSRELHVRINLLGHDDFLSRFSVTLRTDRSRFTLQWLKE